MSKSIGLDEKEFAEDCRRDWYFSLAVFQDWMSLSPSPVVGRFFSSPVFAG